ncbi:alpha/beta fold hydrolase [Cellulomonas shaoxiangyii]|uniref:Alpha/beta fold hydrolase n=1 Tax=Cellulomonas shaoxiangyii TaxID=2566013 RepID=A0A4P7SMJ2_9CELL|nr:alpha/beta fold hydrolase [Cellulomonas shaoxiangyii]TGY79110.1 alpha/beta fold hydrolase [Cellulomonas shaoxiangyii]
MAALVVAVVVTVLTAPPGVAGTAARTDAATATGAPAPVAWRACVEPDLAALGLQCADVAVPRDHRRPHGRRLTLAVARRPADGPAGQRLGSLVVQPGGPGIPGRSTAGMLAARLAPDVLARYDVVGVDPRGVGGSMPRLSCDPAQLAPVQPDPVPAGPAQEAAMLAGAAGYARECAAAHGDLLAHLSSADAARDLEVVRRALGERTLHLAGYGYGAYVAALYATLHPRTVGRLVLDSSLRPDGDLYQHYLDQSRDFDVRAHEFFAWAARHDGTYGLGGTEGEVAAAYHALRARTAQAPVDGVVGPWELEATFLNLGWETAFWPILGQVLADAAVHGDTTLLRLVHQDFGAHPDDTSYAAYTAAQCTDARWSRDWRRWRRDAAATHAQAPFATWNNVWYVAPCVAWPVKARPVAVHGGRVPALVVHATHDAGMRLSGGLAMHAAFPASRLVLSDGGREHSVSLVRGDACVDPVVVRYLVDGALPADASGPGADVTCPAGPEPVPWPAAALSGPDAAGARSHAVEPAPTGPPDAPTAPGVATPWARARG